MLYSQGEKGAEGPPGEEGAQGPLVIIDSLIIWQFPSN